MLHDSSNGNGNVRIKMGTRKCINFHLKGYSIMHEIFNFHDWIHGIMIIKTSVIGFHVIFFLSSTHRKHFLKWSVFSFFNALE